MAFRVTSSGVRRWIRAQRISASFATFEQWISELQGYWVKESDVVKSFPTVFATILQFLFLFFWNIISILEDKNPYRRRQGLEKVLADFLVDQEEGETRR